MKHQSKKTAAEYVRNFTFGVEDSLASTVGLLSGIASASQANRTIVITGLVLIFTEALSMGIGSFLSDQSVQEYSRHKDVSLSRSIPSALIMFISYLIAGIIPIAPYMWLPSPYSLYLSIVLAILALGLLGAINAKISHTKARPHIFRMMILGGSVTVAGVVIGSLLHG